MCALQFSVADIFLFDISASSLQMIFFQHFLFFRKILAFYVEVFARVIFRCHDNLSHEESNAKFNFNVEVSK